MISDEQLVQRIREGDQRAFAELYHRYNRRLFSYILRLVGEREFAEDLFQEVFMTVLRTEHYAPRELEFGGWLFKVARNRCLTFLRDQERHTQKQKNLAGSTSSGVSPSPEDAVTLHRRTEAVARALETLSEPQQEVLLLKAVGGLTYCQIASIQGVPEGTVKSRLHLAVKAVRSLVRPAEVQHDDL